MEQLCPLLQILGGGALVHRKLRKYVRAQILPPLQEVHKRPEEVDTLRGALCRLLTCPVSPVRDLVADLLFVLCKESVSRMVKHTGYGNCAGLLANRGLMLGGRGDRGHYSSESEDSDTEEYKEHRDQINPVIGCCEPPRHNPLANMSEEQKEHEAMQIVNMLDKLTRTGVVLPGRIGEDGKPEPLNHVLQLQECLSNVPSNLGGDESDSD
ncbi:hypothetical protein B566_EDAN010198 [Ephemera danica]|nr:hypothetical protein B566_EDAN010198 [Ephemera danica]